MLALCLKVAAPSGYMLEAPTQDRPFPLVLCTAQGQVLVDDALDAGSHAPTPGEESGDTCPFAAAPVEAPAPADPTWTPVVFVRPFAPARPSLTHLSPGRGLAAPPPARAPPTQLT